MATFRMASNPTLQRVGKLLPAIILVTLVAVGLGSGYYFANAERHHGPTVSWQTNPLSIKFSGNLGTGSASDSFTCKSSIAPVTLRTFSSAPRLVTVTVSPSSFTGCGSTPDNVVVKATCTAAALADQDCGGQNHFFAIVVVCGPTSYECVSRALLVIITISGNGGD